MTDPVGRQRHDRAALEAAIRAAGSTIKGKRCHCPHPDHGDAHPSASIHAGDDGVWRVTCHSRDCWGKGADVFDLRAALTGRPVADLLREARGIDAHNAAQSKPRPSMTDTAKRCHAAISAAQRQALAGSLGVSVDALRRLRVGWLVGMSAYTFPMRDPDGRVIGIRTRHSDGAKRAVTGSTNGLFTPADLAGAGPLLIVEGPTDTAALSRGTQSVIMPAPRRWSRRAAPR
jgi:hypothetical protein